MKAGVSLFSQLVHSEFSQAGSTDSGGTATHSPLFNLRPDTQGTTAAAYLRVVLIVSPRLQWKFEYNSEWLISHYI